MIRAHIRWLFGVEDRMRNYSCSLYAAVPYSCILRLPENTCSCLHGLMMRRDDLGVWTKQRCR